MTGDDKDWESAIKAILKSDSSVLMKLVILLGSHVVAMLLLSAVFDTLNGGEQNLTSIMVFPFG